MNIRQMNLRIVALLTLLGLCHTAQGGSLKLMQPRCEDVLDGRKDTCSSSINVDPQDNKNLKLQKLCDTNVPLKLRVVRDNLDVDGKIGL